MLPDPNIVVWDDWTLLGIQAATLIFLVVYVWKTWQMAAATRRAAEASERASQEAKEARLAASAPAVLVYFDSTYQLSAEIVIENAGAGAAADVSLTFDPPLQSSQPGETDRFFDAVQPLLPPGYRIAQMFDSWPSYLQSDLPKRYEVTVRYLGVQTGRSYEQTYVLDADAVRHRLRDPAGVPQIVEHLEKLAEAATQGWQSLEAHLSETVGDKVVPPPSVLPTEALIQQMIGFWELHEALRTDETPVPLRDLVDGLRWDVARIVRSMRGSAIEDEGRELVLGLARSVYHRDANTMGRTDAWLAAVEARIGEVREAFSDGSVL